MTSQFLRTSVARAIGASLLLASGFASAAAITSAGSLVGSTAVIDFSQFTGGGQLTGVNGPTQIGAVAGYDVTLQDMSGGANVWLYNGGWSLGDNGNWNSAMNGYLGIFPNNGPVRIRFNDGPISGFGAFMNYPVEPRASYLPQTMSAFDASGTLLEVYDIGANDPISTPGALNAGAFRGIQRGSADIAYIEFVGDTAVYDNLTFTATVRVPEPASLALVGLALAGLGLSRRRRA